MGPEALVSESPYKDRNTMMHACLSVVYLMTLNLKLVLQVLLLIDIELSYINTNHEDFIGFAK